MSYFKKFGCLGLFILPFILVSIASLFYFFYLSFKSQQTKFWIRTEAEMVSVDTKKSISRGKVTEKVESQYSFIIEGKKYVNDGICIGYASTNFEDIEQVYNKLHKAKKIIVYVNPNDYNESVIVTGMNNYILFFLVFFLVFGSIVSIFVFSIFFSKQVEPNQIFNVD